MNSTKQIPLFWWSERRLMNKGKETYGDLLSKYLVEKISGKHAKWILPNKQPWYKLNKTHYLSTGSILAQATRHSIVWGSGIVDRKMKIAKSTFFAVRGPETRKVLIEQGYDCPEVYGDPAILLSDLYLPEIEKKYEVGIIPHYVDFKKVSAEYHNMEGVQVIDLMTLDIEKTTDEILACEKIISSSLHGVIVPHTYGIPAIWIQFSNNVFGDNIKYYDYFTSVGINAYEIPVNEKMQLDYLLSHFEKVQALPEKNIIEDLKKDLMEHCPFR